MKMHTIKGLLQARQILRALRSLGAFVTAN